MKMLSQRLRTAFAEKMIGDVAEVLWEEIKEGQLSGWTPNYVRIHTPGREEMINTIQKTKVKSARNGQLWGEII